MKNVTRIAFIIALVSSFLAGHSQTLSVGGSFGIGTWSMKSFKHFQDYRLTSSGLPAQVTDNFPARWTSGVEFGMYFLQFPSRLLAFFRFASTGARVSSMDYSGEMKLDLIASCNQYGIGMEQDLLRKSFFSLSLYGQISYLFSDVKVIDYLRIYDQVQNDEYRFISDGLGLEPGILAGFSIWRFRIGLYGGYLFGFSEHLHLSSSRKAYLQLPNGDDVVPEWNGIRAGITLEFHFTINKKGGEKADQNK